LAGGQLLDLGVNLGIEISLGLEIGDQVLAAFLDQLLIHAELVIERDELLLAPAPDVGAVNLDLNNGTGVYIKEDVSAIGVFVVLCSLQLHLRGQVMLFGEAALQILGGVRQCLAIKSLALADGGSAKTRA